MLKIIGVVVVVIGIVLFVGNVSGAFRTFPGAGWITLLIGGAMVRAGG